MYQELADAPVWVTLSSQITTRRKGPVQCDMCRTMIRPGQRYRSVCGLNDGKFEMIREHICCPQDADEIKQAEEDQRQHDYAEAYDAWSTAETSA